MMAAEICIYTIGHSNRSLEDFLALLKEFDIQALADIRSQPGSRKFPHFNLENLETVLPGHGVRYIWLPKLGGRRRTRKGFQSPNMGLTSPGFRSYADYMGEEEFRQGVVELLSVASESRTAYMCAEALYWQCHRRLLSDYLVAQGVVVLHMLGPKNLQSHKITEGALVTQQGNVVYPAIT
jgi:uncharacterized protein (DUF488 family)